VSITSGNPMAQPLSLHACHTFLYELRLTPSAPWTHIYTPYTRVPRRAALSLLVLLSHDRLCDITAVLRSCLLMVACSVCGSRSRREHAGSALVWWSGEHWGLASTPWQPDPLVRRLCIFFVWRGFSFGTCAFSHSFERTAVYMVACRSAQR
jgi:hypothetical protein